MSLKGKDELANGLRLNASRLWSAHSIGSSAYLRLVSGPPRPNTEPYLQQSSLCLVYARANPFLTCFITSSFSHRQLYAQVQPCRDRYPLHSIHLEPHSIPFGPTTANNLIIRKLAS